MTERIKQMGPDLAKAYVATIATLGITTLTNLELVLKLVLLVVTIAYTLWRWRADARKKDL